MDSPLLHLIIEYRYWILFPLACFEGPVVAFVVGTLCALGYFNPFAAFGILVLGDLVPDWTYYWFGRYGGERPFVQKALHKIGLQEHFAAIKKLWFTHGGKTMFFSKLAYGLSTAFLISAGAVGLPAKKFLLYALPVTLAQYAILLTLGYYFSNSFGIVSGILDHLQILTASVVVVAVGYYFLARYMAGRLLAAEHEVEASE